MKCPFNDVMGRDYDPEIIVMMGKAIKENARRLRRRDELVRFWALAAPLLIFIGALCVYFLPRV